jgi:hypothetical protein
MTFSEGSEKLAHALLLPINPAAVIILGAYTVLWGIWVGNPFWGVFTHAKLYSMLAHFPPAFIPAEYFWGTIAIVCGCIIIYGAVRRGYKALIMGSSVAFWHWLIIGIFYMVGDVFNTGGITALTFAFYAAYIYLNIKVNFKDNKKSKNILSHD